VLLSEWIEAILKPHALLDIPRHDVEHFQLAAVIVVDAIWSARNNKFHNGHMPKLQSLLTQIQTSIAIHYKAWSDIYSWSCCP